MDEVLITGIGTTFAGPSLEDWFAGRELTVEPSAHLDKLNGRKLRYKDRVTTLAIVASQAALDDAGVINSPRITDGFERTGVVASSNFGNLDTVCRTVERIRAGGTAETSPLDLPNASPNVIAASVAIYFGAGAVNLMVTNGATSGLDALALATWMIQADRADRVIVVGAEAATEPVSRLLEEAGLAPELAFDGAAALILARQRPGSSRSYARIASVGRQGQGRERVSLIAAGDALVAEYPAPARSGLAYGAMGVLQAALAARAIAKGAAVRAEIVTGGLLGDCAVRAVLTAANTKLP